MKKNTKNKAVKKKTKIWMMTDLEGVCGVVDFETQTYATGKYYEEAKHFLTQEVNAAVDGIISSGPADVLVLDGHGPGGIIYKELHSAARVFLGRPVPRTWLLDRTYSAAFFIGHHAMSGVEGGNLNHSYSSTSIANIWLNGKKIGEIGMQMFMAGCFDVPVVLVTGDRAGCEEAKTYVPDIETAVVKEGINRTVAVCLSKESARDLIRKKSKKAVGKIGKIKPCKIKGPFELVVEYTSSAFANAALRKRGVKKVNSRTTKIRADNFIDLIELMEL